MKAMSCIVKIHLCIQWAFWKPLWSCSHLRQKQKLCLVIARLLIALYRCLHEWPFLLKLPDLKGFVTKYFLISSEYLTMQYQASCTKNVASKKLSCVKKKKPAQSSFDLPLLLSLCQAEQIKEMKFCLISATHRNRKIF